METLAEQFRRALTRIELTDARRKEVIEVHEFVRKRLEESTLLKGWGIDTVLIGSYRRHTAIYPGKDVDIFCELAALDEQTEPSEVFDGFVAELSSLLGERIEPQRRSVKVTFPGRGLSADAVPAVRYGSDWAIPEPVPSAQPGRLQWRRTNPDKLTEMTSRRNEAPTVGSQGAYVPTVKLVRQVREQHLGQERPGGLYFEMLAYWAFESGRLSSVSSFAEALAKTLTYIAEHFGAGVGAPLLDPALSTAFTPAPTIKESEKAGRVFGDLAGRAVSALEQDRCPAAADWRKILGRNSRGTCLPLPENCDEDGNEIAAVSANIVIGSNEPREFGDGKNG